MAVSRKGLNRRLRKLERFERNTESHYVPLKLSKGEAKKSFALPVETAVYVPSTKGRIKKATGKQASISKAAFKRRTNEVRKYLSKFGGFTSVKGVGGYVGRKGKLKGKVIKENVKRVGAFAEKKKFERNKSGLIKKIRGWGRKWGQESVGYEQEGDLYFISGRNKKKLKGKAKAKALRNLAKARRKLHHKKHHKLHNRATKRHQIRHRNKSFRKSLKGKHRRHRKSKGFLGF